MKKLFMAVIAVMMTVSVSAQFYIYLSNGEELVVDSISMVIPGAIGGEFSVSGTETVQFSRGNLQYQASTDTWRFAPKQYEIVGSGNNNISPTYDGWIDLFGWGTGNNPTLTSEEYEDYATFSEWGANKISNGGYKANLWRTLSIDEWKYIFYDRVNAATLFGFGSVNGVNGLIILPDNWNLPEGASFTHGSYKNDLKNNFTQNTYTAEEWVVMETNGAVFLPVSVGTRMGNSINNASADWGIYWSTTPDYNGDMSSYSLIFEDNSLSTSSLWLRYFGTYVRLVR